MRPQPHNQEVGRFRPVLWSSFVTALLLVTGCHQSQFDLVDGSSAAFGANREPIAENTSTISGPPVQKAQASSAGVDSASTPPSSTIGGTDTNVAEILNRGHREAAMKHLDQAERDYRRALDLQPDNVVANHRLAVLADRKHDFATAEAHYLAALRRDRNNPDLLSDLGYSYLLQGRRQESERYLLAATRLNPKHDKALHNLSLLYAMLGDYDRSFAVLRQAVGESQARIKIAEIFPNGRPVSRSGEVVVASFDPPTPPKAVVAADGESLPAAPAIGRSRAAQSSFAGDSITDAEAITILPAGPTRKAESQAAATVQTDESAQPESQTPLARQLEELMQQERHRAVEEQAQRATRVSRATDLAADVTNAGSAAHAVAGPIPRGPGQQPIARPVQAEFGFDKPAEPNELPTGRVPDSQINDVFAAIDREDVHERQPARENSRRGSVDAGGNSISSKSFSTADRADGNHGQPGGKADPLDAMPLWPSHEPDSQRKFTTPGSNTGLAGAGRTQPRPASEADFREWPASANGSTTKTDDRDAERAAALIGMNADPESLFPTIAARPRSSAVAADRPSQDGHNGQPLPSNVPHIPKKVARVSASVEEDIFSDVRHASDSYDSEDPHRKPSRKLSGNPANAQTWKPGSAGAPLDPWPGGKAVRAEKTDNQTSPSDWPAEIRPSLKRSAVSPADADFRPANDASIPDWPGLNANSRAGGSSRGAQP